MNAVNTERGANTENSRSAAKMRPKMPFVPPPELGLGSSNKNLLFK